MLLYANPDRDSRLDFVGGDGGRFAFIEINRRSLGLGGWKLWYMPDPTSEPVVIDEGGGVLPFFAVDGDRMVWAASDPSESRLVLLDLGSMTQEVLLSSPSDETQYWFPAIDGDHVVFGTVEFAPDQLSDERHIYLLDLTTREEPRRLDQSQSAAQPAIEGDDVIWKESDPEQHFLVAGTLVHYSIESGERQPVTLGQRTDGFHHPTIGSGYVTAWSGDDRSLYLADLEGGDALEIVDMGPTTDDPHDAVVRPSLRSGLLAYVFGPGGGDLELRWVLLP